MCSDKEFFLQQMEGVTLHKKSDKVDLKKAKKNQLTQQAKRQSAVLESIQDDNHLSTNEITILDPFYPLDYKRPGVQNGVYKKLKQGKYASEARLDLHKMTIEKAREEVFAFVKDSYHYDLRVITIVHGKGQSTGSMQAKLKSYVNYWLPSIDAVQAFCSAQNHHGGTGAVYVLLKKSENKKQENRERLSRGRS